MDDLKEFILEKMNEIQDDERFHYPDANVNINAPLAIVQIGMKSKYLLLKEILRKIESIEN